MKHLFTTLKCVTVIALLALVAGCASTGTASTKSKEQALIAAGFKVITPKTADQKLKLGALPADQINTITKKGKTYYVFPDPVKGIAYVGGPKQLSAYKQIRDEQKMAERNLQISQVNAEANMSYGDYDGWDAIQGDGNGYDYTGWY